MGYDGAMNTFPDLPRLMREVEQVAIFLDESEYKVVRSDVQTGDEVTAHIYAIGAAVVEMGSDLPKIEEALAEIRDSLSSSPGMQGRTDGARIKEAGWHLSEDLPEFSVPLWHKIGQELGVKYHYRYFESPLKVRGEFHARIFAVLYSHLAIDLFRRYVGSELHFRFEQYTALNSHFEDLAVWSANRAELLMHHRYRDDTVEIELPEVSVVQKGEYSISSLVDYMTLGVSRLLSANILACSLDPACAGQCKKSVFADVRDGIGHLSSGDRHVRDFLNLSEGLSSAVAVRLHPGVLAPNSV